nr:GT4 family glycosyltransferase PelF [Granulosicoccus sp.]
REKYQDAPPGLDFNHFFWTVRSMHQPLFTLATVAANAPSADLYHSVSTGYAGYLGAMCQSLTDKPYIISEHGIYTKERELDLAQVDWIPEDADPFRVGLNDNMNYLRNVWIRFFQSLGRMSYSSANQIFTLFNGNRLRQIEDGADPERLTIIPNGVDVSRFSQVRRAKDAPVPPVLGLMGRVVPIKDIKNFIRSMRIIRAAIPDAEGWLIGPEDEDPSYTEECRQLARSLDLDGVVRFMGFQKPDDMFPQLGLNVLTSVSEGQPLVVLEGYAAGLPTVTTDVGSCAELVYGINEEDKALGAAGAVVPIANPAKFAEAAIRLLSDREAWNNASAAAINRVEAYYDEVDMVRRYHDVYSTEIVRHQSSERKVG